MDLDALPSCTVAVAPIDGRDLDPENGIYHADTGITTYTLWGEIAYQIGGVASPHQKDCFDSKFPENSRRVVVIRSSCSILMATSSGTIRSDLDTFNSSPSYPDRDRGRNY